VDQARTLYKKYTDPSDRIFIETVAARILGATKKPGGIQSLQRIIVETTKRGLVNQGFEAQLALGEVQLKYGKGSDARATLQALHKNTASKGYMLIAGKAEKLLGH